MFSWTWKYWRVTCLHCCPPLWIYIFIWPQYRAALDMTNKLNTQNDDRNLSKSSPPPPVLFKCRPWLTGTMSIHTPITHAQTRINTLQYVNANKPRRKNMGQTKIKHQSSDKHYMKTCTSTIHDLHVTGPTITNRVHRSLRKQLPNPNRIFKPTQTQPMIHESRVNHSWPQLTHTASGGASKTTSGATGRKIQTQNTPKLRTPDKSAFLCPNYFSMFQKNEKYCGVTPPMMLRPCTGYTRIVDIYYIYISSSTIWR